MPTLEVLDAFTDKLTDDGASVVRCAQDTLSQTVIGLIGRRGWDRVVSVRRGRVGHPSVLGDDPQLSTEELATIEAVITEVAAGAAQEGLVVLDHGPGQGRPGLTLLPGHHVCVVRSNQVVDRLENLELDSTSPITILGGPTGGDEGAGNVHRPGALTVILVG
ncbi:MAG: LUD domain-containing protein [Acidimicrobiia bacterium]|nr:LUD domain-containing protein [Acidimicrobiia bacterium]